jgi:hypothetical protein
VSGKPNPPQPPETELAWRWCRLYFHVRRYTITNFIKVALTPGYGTDGAPAIGADDKWLNLDQVTLIEEHIARPRNGSRRPLADQEEYFPTFQLTLTTGDTWLLPLATTATATEALAALEHFAPQLIAHRPPVADTMPWAI